MYNVHKMLTLDSNPLIRLEKRLASLRHTHNAALARSTFLVENNFKTNRQLMENLILRLHSVDSKSKKNKRVASRGKVGSPKRLRAASGKPQELFHPNFPPYTGFQSKLHSVKRIQLSEYCESPDSTFLKDLKELPPLHPAEVETVLRKKDTGLRNPTQKGEPIFPPPPNPSCTISARTPAMEIGKSGTSTVHRLRKGSQSFNQTWLPPDKYTMPSTSCLASFCQNMRPVGITPSLPSDSYPYVDLRAKYDPDCYQNASSTYDHFMLSGFSNDYTGFSPYTRSSGYTTWASLGKYDQSISGRLAQGSTSVTPPDSAPNYRSYPSTSCPENPPGFGTNITFNQSFQNDNFMHSMPSYPSVEPHQSPYGINLPPYNYPPPNTTSYM